MKSSGLVFYCWGCVLNFGLVGVLFWTGGIYGVFGTSEGLLFLAMTIFLLLIIYLVIHKKHHHPLLVYGTPLAIALLIMHEMYRGEPTFSTLTLLFLGIGSILDRRVVSFRRSD